jgi:hypothetical protein
MGVRIQWVEKFKQIGDIAVHSDQAHATLPWAGIRFLLQVCTPTRHHEHIQVF